MRRSAFWAAAGAALIVIVATEAAAARGVGGNNVGEGHLRQQIQNPAYIKPSPYAYCYGCHRNKPSAEQEVYRHVYSIYSDWGWKYRQAGPADVFFGSLARTCNIPKTEKGKA